MNESPSSQRQFHADSEFSDAWKQAGHDLGISVEAPFTLRTDDGEFIFPALIREFGRPLGTLILTGATSGSYDRRAYGIAQALGYFVSILADPYARYDRQLFVDTLDDWQCFGQQQQPSWYSGTPSTL